MLRRSGVLIAAGCSACVPQTPRTPSSRTSEELVFPGSWSLASVDSIVRHDFCILRRLFESSAGVQNMDDGASTVGGEGEPRQVNCEGLASRLQNPTIAAIFARNQLRYFLTGGFARPED